MSVTKDIRFHPAALEEFAENQYPFYTDAFREYWCNAYDVDSLKVETTITPYKVTIEDWGAGVENFDLFWYIGSPHKKELNLTPILGRPIIGRKGLGKLSFRKIGKKVDAVSRTASGKAFYSTIDFKENKYSTTEYKKREEIEANLNHIGTKFEISELSDFAGKINLKDVEDYCKKNMYGIIIPGIVTSKPIDIIINQKKVEAEFPKGRVAKINCSLEGIEYGTANGILSPSKSSKLTKIDALCRGIKIKEINNPAPTHPVDGFINANWLNLTTNRHDFIMDTKEYAAFHVSLRNYLIDNLPTSEEIISRRKIKSINYLAKLMEEVIREVGMPQGTAIPEFKEPPKPKPEKKWIISKPEEEKPYEPPAIVIETQPHKLDIKVKPIKSKYGIKWYPAHCGKDKSAIIADPISMDVIFNIDHELLKRCDDMRPREQRAAFASLFSRGYALLKKEQDKGLENFNKFVDDISAKLISKIEEYS